MKSIKKESIYLNFIEFSNLESHFILYNYIPGLDLYQTLSGFFELNDKSLTVVSQINNGLFELFNNNLVHLDIKLENIILTNKNPIKLKL